MTIQRSIFLRRCVLILHGTLSTAEVLCSVDSIAHHRLQASLLHSSLSSWQWSMAL